MEWTQNSKNQITRSSTGESEIVRHKVKYTLIIFELHGEILRTL